MTWNRASNSRQISIGKPRHEFQTMIPLAKPTFDHRELEAVKRVLASGWVVQGPEVEAFEQAIASLHSAKHCIAVSSGTAALHVAYLALGIGPGDAVFVPSFAWPSAANMAAIVGARPVFVDVLPSTYNMDPQDLRRQVRRCMEDGWGRPRVVVPVHEFGLAADMEAILQLATEFSLEVVEDAACALGAKYRGRPVGRLGRLGVFSFHPRKAITTGEGGAVVTDCADLAARCRMWRNHGQTTVGHDRVFPVAGLNYRMTEIQAAIGSVQLGKLQLILQKRQQLVAAYLRELRHAPGVALPFAAPEHTWQTFMVLLKEGRDRSVQIERLTRSGFGVGPGSVAGHCAEFYARQFGYKPSDLPVSALLESQGLALPLHTYMETSDACHCASLLRLKD